MQRIVGWIAVFVISVSVLLCALKTPLQRWGVDFCLQRHCQSTFGTPISYSDPYVVDGQLTLSAVQLVSSAGYTLSAEKVSIPFEVGLLSLHFATIEHWMITNGKIMWREDGLSCSITCDPVQGSLTFQDDAQLGTMRFVGGQWEFAQMPLQTLLRLASLKNSQWQVWNVASGEVTGQWGATDGRMTVVKPAVRHSKFPVALEAERGELTLSGGSRVTFDAPILLSAGNKYRHWLQPGHWNLDLKDRDSWEWVWEAPFARPGRVVTTIRSLNHQVALEGDYQSSDGDECFGFQVAIPADGQVRGHLVGRSLSLKTTLAALANQFLDGRWSGNIDLEGDIHGSVLTVHLQPHDLAVETDHYRVAFEALTTPIAVAFDVLRNDLRVHLKTDHSSFWDKNTGLLLSEISVTIDAAGNQWQMSDLEAYYRNLRFVGGGTYTKQDPDHSELTLHVDAITGRLSQLQELLIFLSPTGFVQVVALDGDVQLGPKGGDLSLITRSGDRQLMVNAEGSLLDGKWNLDLENLSIQEVGAHFTYAYPANTLTLRDLQGVIFIGCSGERMEEYQFSGDQLTFTDYAKQQMQFDIWVGDRRRDVLRLAGFTKASPDGALQFHFDRTISHVGSVHPDILELSLLNWKQVNTFQLGLDFRLDRFLHDLQRFDRTGLVPIDEKLSKGLQSLEIAEGECRFDCRYQRALNAFDYHLRSDLLTLNHRPLNNVELKGNVQGDAWLLDPLRWNDLAFSAELVKFPDRWRIDFLGIRVGDFMLAGLEGLYLTQLEQVEARVNLLEVNLARLPWLPLAGRWKSSGRLHIDLTEFPLRYPLFAELEGAVKGLIVNGIQLGDSAKTRSEISALDGLPLLKMQLQGLTIPGLAPQDLIHAATLIADTDQLSVDASLIYRNQPMSAHIQTRWKDHTTGTLTLSDHYPLPPDALTVIWNREQRLFTASQARGTLYGMTVDLKRDLRQNALQANISAIGTISLDLQKLAPLLPEELALQVQRWRLGNGFVLKGQWGLSGLLPETLTFGGELTGSHCALGGCTIEHLKAKMVVTPQDVVLSELDLSDPAFRMNAETFSLHHTSDHRWQYSCRHLVCEDVELSKITGLSSQQATDYAGWSLPIFNVDDLSGYLEDSESTVGKGSIQFLRSSRLRGGHRGATTTSELFAKVAMPDLALPATGVIDWEINDRLISLKGFKDVYSEGKLLKYSLVKGRPVASIDFDGRLNMVLRVKPTRQLLKLTDKSIVSIQGTVKEPQIALQDDK